MTSKMVGLPLALLATGGLAGCATTGSPVGDRQTCRPAAATALVGTPAGDDAAILSATGSALIRRIAPGDATTKDYRMERVTVTVADGRVVAASCG